jgi:hypothetical protein
VTASRDTFRTEVFIRDGLDPIARRFAYGDDALSATVPRLAAAAQGELNRAPANDEQSQVALWSVLALEAVFWLRFGVEEGALPEDTVEVSIERNPFWRTAISMADDYGAALTLDAGLNIRSTPLRELDFFDALTLAHEALTPEHLEFLRLVHFATNDEWRVRLAEVELLTSNATRSVADGLAPGVMDRLSWALSGRPEDGFAFFPASWRWWWIAEPRHTALRTRSGSRWSSLLTATNDLRFLLQPLWPDVTSQRTLRLVEQGAVPTDD